MTTGRSAAWPNGSTTAWRKTRALVLRRDGYRCQLQYDGCRGLAREAHHTLDRTIYGDNPAHIIAVCPPCNKKAGAPGAHPTQGQATTVDPAPTPRTEW